MSNSEKVTSIRIITVLNMPSKVNDFIPFASGIHYLMSNNIRYSGLSPKLDVLAENIKALTEAQAGMSTKPPVVTSELRNLLHDKVKSNLRSLLGNVQEMADVDRHNALIIISDAGMSVKRIKVRQKQKNTVANGPVSGSVYLTAAGKGAFNWRISSDGINWTVLLGSKNAAKIVTGLIEGELYYFQNGKALFNGLEGAWSESIHIYVKKY